MSTDEDTGAMLVIDGRYFSHMWFVSGPAQEFDVLGAMFRNPTTGRFMLRYRFRYHVDAKVFDSEDRRNHFEIDTKAENEGELLGTFSKMFRTLADKAGLDYESIPIRTGDPEAILKIMDQQPWTESKKMAIDSITGERKP
jgi:hypothetical protein